MAFKALFLAHAPDADREKHRSAIDTGMYQLFTVVGRDQTEAVEVCRDFVEKKNIFTPENPLPRELIERVIRERMKEVGLSLD